MSAPDAVTLEARYAHDVPEPVPFVAGRPPQGWDGLGRCVIVARALAYLAKQRAKARGV